MPALRFKAIFFIIAGLLYRQSFSQDYSPKLGPNSNKNKFRYLPGDSKQLSLRRFTPKKDNVVIFNKEGKQFKLDRTDTITVSDIYEGSWSGKKGKWLSFYDQHIERSGTFDYYVLLNQMKDVEKESKISDVAKYAQFRANVEKAENEKIKARFKIAGIAATILTVLIGLMYYRSKRPASSGSINSNSNTNFGGYYPTASTSDTSYTPPPPPIDYSPKTETKWVYGKGLTNLKHNGWDYQDSSGNHYYPDGYGGYKKK